MNIISNLQSRLGWARGDVTVALFLAAAAVVGAVYIQFFDSRSMDSERRELLLLERRRDSLKEARRDLQHGRLEQTLAGDSISEWAPLTSVDSLADVERETPRASSSGKKIPPTSPININAASAGELMRLPGVGEKTAQTIVAYREHAPFRRAEDIMNVKGIGQKKFEKMKPFVRVK